MKALIYQGVGQPLWTEVAPPVLRDSTDVIVRVDATTICGTDLHILAGDLPEVRVGRTLGHEAVGTVVHAGAAVRTRTVGDRVLLSCISACGSCRYCRQARYGQCRGGGGWILGHHIDGTQAEFVRVPFADMSTYAIPAGVSDEQMLMLADILPTAFEVGVLAATVTPGDVVTIVGAGPIGLAAVLAARLFSPGHLVVIDPVESRRRAAMTFGADVVTDSPGDDTVHRLTEGLGADVVIEAVGRPESFESAVALARPGGRVANIGVHGHPATLHLENLWAKDLTITTGLVDTHSIARLIGLVADRRLDTTAMITHRFPFDGFEAAYDVFARPVQTGALKVVITRTE